MRGSREGGGAGLFSGAPQPAVDAHVTEVPEVPPAPGSGKAARTGPRDEASDGASEVRAVVAPSAGCVGLVNSPGQLASNSTRPGQGSEYKKSVHEADPHPWLVTSPRSFFFPGTAETHAYSMQPVSGL